MLTDKMIAFLRCNLSNEFKKVLWLAFRNDFNRLYDKIAGKVSLNIDCARDELDVMLHKGYNFLSIDDTKYPILLKRVSNAPVLFTARGDLNTLDIPSIAVVGSRKTESEDFSIIRAVVDEIVSVGFAVISGLADGTDCIAHAQSLEKGTISVMPCGIERCYSRGHEFLVDKILEMGGLILSEYPYNTKVERSFFAHRNRIIVGISNAVFVGRARDIKCGTMLSVAFAEKFHRSMYTYNFSGKSDGNKYILSNNIAELISMENFKYKLLIDKTENDILLKNNEDDDADLDDRRRYDSVNSLRKNTLFTSQPDVSIQMEIADIVKYSNYNVVTKGKMLKIFKACREKMRINDKDILSNLIDMYM